MPILFLFGMIMLPFLSQSWVPLITSRVRHRLFSTTGVEWERFEFSDSPKMDQRFQNDPNLMAANAEKLEGIRHIEEQKDKEMAKRINQQQQEWIDMEPEIVAKATQVLLPWINEQRTQKIKQVLQQRTRNTRFLFENPANPSNVFACLRTIESFGIQHVDIVIQSQRYQGKAALSQKRGMRTAMGSAQWLSLRNHPSTTDAIKYLKEKENCRILASDLNPNSKDIRDINWNSYQQPVCIVMGNEESGISQEMRELADETFALPMVGFAESFNLSVATAITCAHLSAASQGTRGPLRMGDLPEHEYNCLFLRGLIHSLPQKRMAEALLRKENIHVPRTNLF